MIGHEQPPSLPTTMKLETFLLHSDFGFQLVVVQHPYPHKQLIAEVDGGTWALLLWGPSPLRPTLLILSLSRLQSADVRSSGHTDKVVGRTPALPPHRTAQPSPSTEICQPPSTLVPDSLWTLVHMPALFIFLFLCLLCPRKHRPSTSVFPSLGVCFTICE